MRGVLPQARPEFGRRTTPRSFPRKREPGLLRTVHTAGTPGSPLSRGRAELGSWQIQVPTGRHDGKAAGLLREPAHEIAAAVNAGAVSARAIAEASAAAIASANPRLERLHRRDPRPGAGGGRRGRCGGRRRRARCRSPACPMGSRTSSTSRASSPAPARRSTATIRRHAPTPRSSRRMQEAGAVLLGALNMGEYAYDFTGENVHDGAVAQSARSEPHVGRLVRRLGDGGRRRHGAGLARLRHQRLDPRSRRRSAACSASSRPSAGCRAPAPSRSAPASTMSARSPARRATSRSSSTRCRAPTRAIRRRPRPPLLRPRPSSTRASTASASRSPAATSASAACRRRTPPSTRSPRRSAPTAR